MLTRTLRAALAAFALALPAALPAAILATIQAAIPAAPALAGGAPFAAGAVADVSILPGWRTSGGTHLAALRIRLAPGWKTYWRAPGDAGIPPQFDWSGSHNLRGVAFHWPTPGVFESNGMRTLGYADELILPIELTPRIKGQDIVLRAGVALGVCQDVCMPMNVRVAADLTPQGQADPRIRKALAAQPRSAAQAGVTGAHCRVEPIADGLRITATLSMPSLGPGEIAVFEHPDQSIWVGEAKAHRQGGALTAVTEMVPPSNRPFPLDRSRLRITVLGRGGAVDITGCTG